VKRPQPRFAPIVQAEAAHRESAAAKAKSRRQRQRQLAAGNNERLIKMLRSSLAGATAPDLRERLQAAIERLEKAA
jgi:uncharacterized Zn finger protein